MSECVLVALKLFPEHASPAGRARRKLQACHAQGEALHARDFDALGSLYAPDAIASFGPLGSHKGRAAIRRFFEDFTGSFGDYENEFEEIRDLGGGVVFVVFVQRGRPPGANDWVQFRSAAVLTLTAGRIERQTNNVDLDEARAAAERLAEERAYVQADRRSARDPQLREFDD